MLKSLSIMGLMLSLAACSATKDRDLITNSTRPIAPSLASEIDPNYAVAYLPRIAGPITAVRQKSANNRIHQTVLYPNIGYGGGENQIIVDVSQALGNSQYFQAPSRREIMLEMKKFFPHMRMTISETPGENLHGIYGYAHGTSKIDGNCIYAWQLVKDVTREDIVQWQKFLQPKYSAKARIRYCHPTKTTRELLVLMNGFRVKEVKAETMEMLRFAEGAGYVRPQVQTVPVAAPKPVAKKPAAKRRVTRTYIKKPTSVPAGPRVLLPSEVDNKTHNLVADQQPAPVKIPTKVASAEPVGGPTLLIPIPD